MVSMTGKVWIVLAIGGFLAAQTQPPRRPGIPPGRPPDHAVRGQIAVLGSGVPVKRALLELVPLDDQGQPVTALSDEKGLFEFRSVRPGTYQLFCEKSGFVSTYFGAREPGEPGAPFTVADRSDLRSVDIQLSRGSLVSGRVVDEYKEAIQAAAVTLLRKRYKRGRVSWERVQDAQSDDRGQFTFEQVSPGVYYLRASSPEPFRRAIGYSTRYFANGKEPSQASRLEVLPNIDYTSVEVHFDRDRTVALTGWAYTANGMPSSGGVVWAELLGSGKPQQGWVRSDGSFRLDGLAPGSYRLAALTVDINSIRYLDLGDDRKDFRMTPTPGISVRGRLFGKDGPVRAFGQVRLVLQDDFEWRFLSEYLTPLSWDQRFEFAPVMPGTYTLSLMLTGPGSDAFYISEISLVGRDVGTTVVVGEEPLPGMLDVRLEKGGAVIGAAYDKAGVGLRGVYTVLVPTDPSRRTDERHLRAVPTAMDGSFALRGVPPGDYLLFLWPRSDPSALASPEVFYQAERYGQRVRMEKAGEVTVSVSLVAEIERLARTQQ